MSLTVTDGITKTPLVEKAEAALINNFEGLSIDDAMFYLSVISLHNKDSLIKEKMDDMKKDQTNIKEMRDLITAINAKKDSKDQITIDSKTIAKLNNIEGFKWPAGSDSTTGKLKAPTSSGDDAAKKTENNALLKQITDQLDNKIKDTNTNVEMKNLELQRLMTQRSQVIDITTQIQKKADDSRASIIRNI
jgi:hypothetical protein